MAKKKKRTNPRRRLVTAADLNKAMKMAQKDFETVVEEIKGDAFSKSIKQALIVSFAVLHDKYGWGKVRMQRYFNYIDELAEAIAMGYVSIDDLEKMLFDECGIELLDDETGGQDE